MNQNNPLTFREMILLSLMDAILITSQMLFGMIAGIELVSVLYVCFCLSFGARLGWFLGILFSITRCLVYGFYPNVLILYLLYYSISPFLIGFFMKHKNSGRILAAFSLAVLGWGILSPFPKSNWIIWMAGLTCLALICLLFFTKNKQQGTGCILIVFITLLFTCIDDGLAFLFYGLTLKGVYGYFLASLPVMILQAFNNLIAFSLFSMPLKRVFNYIESSFLEKRT